MGGDRPRPRTVWRATGSASQKKMEKRKKKKRKGEKTGPGHGQRVLHHKNLVLLHNLLDECKDGKWMNNVREDILLVLSMFFFIVLF